MKYTVDQVARGRAAVEREDAAKLDSRLEIGDIVLEFAPISEPGWDRSRGTTGPLVTGYADEIGLSAETVEQYRKVAAGYSHTMRTKIQATGVKVAYSTIREAALNYSDGEKDAHARWTRLLKLCEKAKKQGRSSITAQEYRGVIKARLVPNQITEATVTEAVRSKPHIAQAAAGALAESPSGRVQAIKAINSVRAREQKPSPSSRTNVIATRFDMIAAMRRIRHNMGDLIEEVAPIASTLDTDEIAWIQTFVAWVKNAADLLHDASINGSIHDQLADLLSEEEL